MASNKPPPFSQISSCGCSPKARKKQIKLPAYNKTCCLEDKEPREEECTCCSAGLSPPSCKVHPPPKCTQKVPKCEMGCPKKSEEFFCQSPPMNFCQPANPPRPPEKAPCVPKADVQCPTRVKMTVPDPCHRDAPALKPQRPTCNSICQPPEWNPPICPLPSRAPVPPIPCPDRSCGPPDNCGPPTYCDVIKPCGPPVSCVSPPCSKPLNKVGRNVESEVCASDPDRKLAPEKEAALMFDYKEATKEDLKMLTDDYVELGRALENYLGCNKDVCSKD